MREETDGVRVGLSEDVRHVLEFDARDERAVEIVDVARRSGGGGPGEEDRHPIEAGVLDELAQPQDRVRRGVVVAVHEEKKVA